MDTTVWVDYLKGRENPETGWLERGLGREGIALTDVILCEVLQGVRSEAEFGQIKKELLKFEVFPTGGVAFALEAARNSCELRRKGFTVRKTIDCWVATFCLREGHSLLHRDRDYDMFERVFGLSVIRP